MKINNNLRMCLKDGLLMVAFAYCQATIVQAATYYVDNTVPNCSQNGNVTPCCSDSHTTTQNSQARPWCTVGKGNTTHAAGDTVLFNGEFREQLIPKAGLSDTQRTVYSGYTNDKSATKILGSDEIDRNSWTLHSGNIYRAPFVGGRQCRNLGGGNVINVINTNCWIDRSIWLNRADPGKRDGSEALSDLNEAGEFFYDQTTSQVYVWLPNGDNPANHKIECSKRPVFETGGYTDPPVPQVHNFTLQNLTIMQTLGRGMTFNPGPHRPGNITIQNSEIAFTTGSGFCAGNPAAIYHGNSNDRTPDIPNIKVLNNVIRDAGSDRGSIQFDPRIPNNHAGCGLEYYTVKDSVIEGNEIYNTAGAIGMKQGNANMLIKNNNIHHSGLGIWIGPPSGGNSPDAPLFTGTSATVVGNLLHNMSSEGGWVGLYTSNGNTKVDIYNNTFIKTRGITIGTDNLSDNTYRKDNVHIDFRNNIMHELDSDYGLNDLMYMVFRWNSLATSQSDYNLFFTSVHPAANFAGVWTGGSYGSYISHVLYPSLASWQTGTGQDANSSVVNPLFINPASNNYALQSNSPARNTGLWISGVHCVGCGTIAPACRTWYGSNPDRGAFEFVEACVGDNSPPAAPSGLQVQ